MLQYVTLLTNEVLSYACWSIQVGKISLYAASSAIKEIQKLVLDPKYVSYFVIFKHNLYMSVYRLSSNLWSE